MSEIYFDNGATTRALPQVREIMDEVLEKEYGNPSSMHMKGFDAEKYVNHAKEIIAKSLKVDPKEIYFTSGGTEANNLALIGTAFANKRERKHIITSCIEHASVYNPLSFLEDEGFEVTYLPVDEHGIVDLEALKKALRKDTLMVSIMCVNNEIGAIEPVEEIGKIVKSFDPKILFHTDCIQAYGKLNCYPKKWKADMISVSGHKIHGPKGIGFIYIKNGTKIKPIIWGGNQQKGMRSGTENVPGIAGLGTAAKLAMENMAKRAEKEKELRDYFIDRISAEIPYTVLNGHREDRLPNNINFCFRFVEGESVLIMLDQAGICASSGSACTSGAIDPSHVLRAIGLSDEMAHESLRLTLSYENTKEEIDTVVGELKRIVERLRGMSPAYKAFLDGEKE